MVSKKNKLIELIKCSNFKPALKIAKTFVIEFNKDQQRTISIAYEVLTGHGKLYQQLGINTIREIEKAKDILKNYAQTI
jgi:hypothetical protein